MARASHPCVTQVRGVLAGHATDLEEETGTSVLVFPGAARGAAEARGGAPGTLHTDALGPLGCYGILGAVFLTGGSLYGLDAQRGIRRKVLAQGGGRRLWGSHDRIVGISGAVLFDLPHHRPLRADYEKMGWTAAGRARDGPLASGTVGAGTGATVGKFLGRKRAMSGGVGTWALPLPGGFHVGALVAVNSVGNILDPSHGTIVAGARRPEGGWATPGSAAPGGSRKPTLEQGTTLAVVATDLPLSRRDLGRVAQAGHDGIARCVFPAHMSVDGDTVFAVSTAGEPKGTVWPGGGEGPYPGAVADLVGASASECVSLAILDAVRSADSRRGLPSASDLAP